jgi:hypothetical protein
VGFTGELNAVTRREARVSAGVLTPFMLSKASHFTESAIPALICDEYW